jgi:hypothetical protein
MSSNILEQQRGATERKVGPSYSANLPVPVDAGGDVAQLAGGFEVSQPTAQIRPDVSGVCRYGGRTCCRGHLDLLSESGLPRH